MSVISVAGRAIGDDCPCFIIAEVGLSHNGELRSALAYIDAAVNAGADAVKFQTHIASAEGTAEETFRVKMKGPDKTRQEYWQRTSFTEQEWADVKAHTDSRGVIFLSSPFSEEAADLLERIGVPAWKIASGETNNLPLIRKLIATGLPLLVSSGMSGV